VIADVTVIDLQEGSFELIDQMNNKRVAKRKLVPVAVVHGGTLTTIDPAVHQGLYAGVKV
jgi:predicted amidohydrolase